MASPFTLFGMARRATANLRQMTYSVPATPATPPVPEDAGSDTASISSKTGRKRTSPLIPAPTRRPTTAVVDTVTVTSSPPSSPPAKSVLSDVASNGSSTTLAQEPAGLSESPQMETVDLKGPTDYFSLRKSSGSKDSPAVEELEKAMKRLESQLRSLAAEKEKIASDLQTANADKELIADELKAATVTNNRLDKEIKDLRTKTEESGVETSRLEAEKTSLAQKVRDLAAENDGLVKRERAKEAQWNSERAQLADGMVREVEAMEKAKSQLEQRVVAVERNVAVKQRECEKLEETVAALKKEKADSARAISSLQQYLGSAREELKAFQVQAAKDIDGARRETIRVAQQAKEERAAWDVEHQRLVEESAQEKQRFEGEKRSLEERLVALEEELEALEGDRKALEDDVYSLRLEKEKNSGVIADLQHQLGMAKEELEKVRASAAEKAASLQKDLDFMREERDRQLGLKDNYIHSLTENVRNLKAELTQTRQSTKEIVAQNDATISQLTANLTERKRMLDEMERERESLREHFIVLGDELEGKEREKKALEDEVADLTKEKDQRGRMVSSLQEQLTLAAEEMKILQDTSTAKTIALEEELRRMREERDQSPCTIM